MPGTERKTQRVAGKELPLECGQEMVLQLADDPKRLRCVYLGARRREFLILDPPLIPDYKARFAAGTRVTARFLAGGAAYGFVSSILHFSLRPSPLLFLDAPFTVETLSLRSCERVEVFLRASLDAGSGPAPGAITDLSCGGCHFAADLEAHRAALEDLAEGQEAYLDFALSPEEEITGLPCLVLSRRRDTATLHLGLRFTRTEPRDEERIARLVEDIARLSGR